MLYNKKQIADGNDTGIILLPYRSGALYKYPINSTEDMQDTNNDKLPLIYLKIVELFCLIPKIPMQIRINNNEVIGDMRPIKTF
jgi:hypothetical protein